METGQLVGLFPQQPQVVGSSPNIKSIKVEKNKNIFYNNYRNPIVYPPIGRNKIINPLIFLYK